jgi:Zn-dependent protease
MTDLLADPAAFLLRLVLQLPALLIAVTVHELAHALVADRLGDPTPRALGRLTLNPLPHIDPLGALAFVLAGFGWAKPVPVNANHFKNPLRDMTWVAVAGPIANFLAAFAALVLLVALELTGFLPKAASRALWYIYTFNLVLGIFNLIPLPPLDGGHFLPYLLPRRLAGALHGFERWGMLILLVLVFTGIIQRILGPAFLWASQVMISLARLIV